MKHQSLIEHLNLPPGYDTEVIEKAIERYFDTAKKWHYSEGWEDGYRFFTRDNKYKLVQAALIGAISGCTLMIVLSVIF